MNLVRKYKKENADMYNAKYLQQTWVDNTINLGTEESYWANRFAS